MTERDERLFLKSAAINDCEVVFKYLKMGINIEVKDFFGWSALVCAAAAGALEVVQLLIAHGADLDFTINGVNAEELARKNKNSKVAEYISKFR
jgi:ankyrin repeat protein